MGDNAPSTPPDADISASRGLDFYTYINRDWQRDAKIMPYDSSFSVSDEIETRVENTIFSTIDKLRKTAPTDPFTMLVNSILIPKYQINNIYDIQRLSNLFDCMNNADDVGRMIGRLNRIQANAPLSFVVANDRYIPNKRCVYIYEPKLGAALIAAKAQAPLLPITLQGTQSILPQGKRFPQSVPLIVRIGEVIPPPVSTSKSDLEAVSAQCALIINQMLKT